MAEITPDTFDEMFTIHLNTEGKPVQRKLRDMTVDDVMQALLWNNHEASCLEAAAKPFLQQDDDPPAPGELSEQELIAWANRKEAEAILLMQSAEAFSRSARLEHAVCSLIPEADMRMPLRDALHRYWPDPHKPS